MRRGARQGFREARDLGQCRSSTAFSSTQLTSLARTEQVDLDTLMGFNSCRLKA